MFEEIKELPQEAIDFANDVLEGLNISGDKQKALVMADLLADVLWKNHLKKKTMEFFLKKIKEKKND